MVQNVHKRPRDTYYFKCFVSSKIYDKRDNFEILDFPFLDRDIPRATSYGVIHLIRFVRVSTHFAEFNIRNKILKAKLLKQGYRYQKFFKMTYRCYYDLVSKFNVGLKSHKACRNLNFMVIVYKFRKQMLDGVF